MNLLMPPIGLRKTKAFAALIAAALALNACGGNTTEPLPREQFIEVMAELRRAAHGASPEEFEARKAVILQDANVSDSALVQYVRAHAGRLDQMAEVWDSVNARLQAAEDSLR